MRLIVPGIPHTATNPTYVGCAFTQKIRKFCKMMSSRGHEVVHYGHVDSDVVAYSNNTNIQHITITDDALLEQTYGTEYTQDQAWITKGFNHYYDINDQAHKTFSENFIKAYKPEKHDIIVSFWGWGHKQIHDALPKDSIFVEGGIGYPSAFARWRIYESHAIMNAMYGAEAVGHCNMDSYHRVIPNYFDINDFDYREDKKPYILYLGRIGANKGIHIAIDATKRAGVQLVVAGQGTLKDVGYEEKPDHVIEVGYANPNLRADLLSNARALFIASQYLEPFAGVQVEAWLSGTPVISPNYAAFAELNMHGITGYRCNTMRDYVDAINNVPLLFSRHCKNHGLNFTLERVAVQYEEYFEDLLKVYTGEGWYDMTPRKETEKDIENAKSSTISNTIS